MSGSGVLLGGEIANGVITILGLSCRERENVFAFLCFFLGWAIYSCILNDAGRITGDVKSE